MTKNFAKEENKMKRKLIILSTMIFFFLALTGIGQAQDFIKGFSLKFTGGYGTMAIGDLNTFIEGADTFLGDVAGLFGGTKEGELKKLNKWGYDLEGEIIMNLTENFGIGVGAGYIQKRSTDSWASARKEIIFGVGMTISLKPEFSAIPINLSVYYFSSVAPSVNIFLYGGLGYYFGKVTASATLVQDFILAPPQLWSEELKIEAKDQNFGLHGGIGLEFNVAPKIALFIEGKGRYCKLKSWKGDGTITSGGNTERESGTIWFAEIEVEPATGIYIPFIFPSEEEPSEDDARNVRKFEADLSGISLKVGIRIKF